MVEITNWFKRIEGLGGIKFGKGELEILGTPDMILPINTLVLLKETLNQKFGRKEINDIFYSLGKMQSKMGLNQMIKKFGLKKDLKFLRGSMEQPKTIGYGNLNLKKYDPKNKIIQFESDNTPFAKQYKKLFGIQKESVDDFIRGSCAGTGEIMFDEECLAIEKTCMSKGHKTCLFEVRPLKNWDLKNTKIPNQMAQKIDLIEQRSGLKKFLQK